MGSKNTIYYEKKLKDHETTEANNQIINPWNIQTLATFHYQKEIRENIR